MADKEAKKGYRFSNFKTDKRKEEEGVWIDYESGFRVKIARIGSSKYQEFMLKESPTQIRRIETGAEDIKVSLALVKKAIAETILLDWENLLDDNDKEIPFSPENALKCLEESNDFYQEIFTLAKDRTLFLQEKEKAAAKNS